MLQTALSQQVSGYSPLWFCHRKHSQCAWSQRPDTLSHLRVMEDSTDVMKTKITRSIRSIILTITSLWREAFPFQYQLRIVKINFMNQHHSMLSIITTINTGLPNVSNGNTPPQNNPSPVCPSLDIQSSTPTHCPVARLHSRMVQSREPEMMVVWS